LGHSECLTFLRAFLRLHEAAAVTGRSEHWNVDTLIPIARKRESRACPHVPCERRTALQKATQRSGIGPQRALEANTKIPRAQRESPHSKSFLSERRTDPAEPPNTPSGAGSVRSEHWRRSTFPLAPQRHSFSYPEPPCEWRTDPAERHQHACTQTPPTVDSPRASSDRRVTVKSNPPGKTGYFVLEGTNAFAASYYFNYLMFLLQQDHGFSNLNNLTLGAVHGFLYVGASWFAGRFGQRHGYFTSLRIGFGGMGAGVALGWLFPGTIGQIGALLLWTLAMCFTWPMLEALASEREPKDRLPNRIGLYNVIWASTAGLAYFVGGSLFQRLGKESLYWLPLIIHALQWMSLGWLERRHAQNAAMETHPSTAAQITAETAKGDPRITQVFQKLAWIGNPFAYMGMNTIIAVVPSIAEHAGLGIEAGGRLMSAWFIVRTLTFAVLWAWHGWHYRVGWFLGSFLLLIVGFITVMTSHQIWILILAQIAFGWGTGLIYYSSLFYAMDGSDTHGEHGGIHEAFIGIGIGSGPAISSLALWLSGATMAPAIAVGATLVGGWTWCWKVARRTQADPGTR